MNALRGALARAPQPQPEIPGVPLSGGLVGYTAYDAVRYFERLPGRSLDATVTPHAHYVAPCSLLVFDHLTRSAALLHDGSEAERQALRREVMRALRGAVPTLLDARELFTRRRPRCRESAHAARRAARAGIHRLAAMYISWCSPRASRDGTRSRLSRSIGRCGCSIRRLTCSSASSATSPWWAPRPKPW